MEFSQILLNAQSPDANIRKEAEAQLQRAETQNLSMFLLALTGELADNNKNPLSRRLAGIVLKNRLDAKDEAKRNLLINDWLNLDVNIRNQIKAGILQTLGSPVGDARHGAAQVCAKIALIELPRNLWPNLIDILLNNMTQSQIDNLKQATLQTLGYICEEIDPAVVVNKSDQILTAVVQGMRAEEPNNEVKLAAAKALENALEFAKANFEKETERNYIMTVVCDCTRSPDVNVKVAGFECLVKIASLYYEKLPPYMQSIFNLTLESIKKEPEPVALQAIEFWSTICDEEIYLLDEADEAAEMGVPASHPCHNFIKGALKYLVPLVLETLTKQEEDADEDTWDVAMAGATCLNLIANTVSDAVIEHVVPFVQQHITNPDWHFREAAVMAFGSILEGPKDAIVFLIRQALPILLQHMKDSVVQVKDTAAWTIGRVCQLHPVAVRGEPFNPVMQALLESLPDSPRVATNVCWAFHNIAEAFEDEDIKPADSFAPYFQPVVLHLLNTTERPDADENNLRCTAYEAINAFIQAASADCIQIVTALVPVFLERLEKSFNVQILTVDDRDTQNETQALLCGVLQTCTQKLEDKVKPFADKMMALFLQVFNSKNASVHEEALMAVGALANAVEADFDRYMPPFRHFLLLCLRAHEEYQVCSVAVGVVGDICRAIQKKVSPYCDEIITVLLQNLQNPLLNRVVKPPILSCLGDVALAISGDFAKYLTVVMTMLQQAAATQVDMQDDELVDYLNQLREGIFEAYTGILQGLRTDNQADHFLPYTTHVVNFVGHVFTDQSRTDAVTRGAIGVLGDLAHALGAKVKAPLNQDFVKALINESIQSENDQTREVAKWTEEVISKL